MREETRPEDLALGAPYPRDSTRRWIKPRSQGNRLVRVLKTIPGSFDKRK